MSLDWDNLETPAAAFEQLLPEPSAMLEEGALLATEVTTGD